MGILQERIAFKPREYEWAYEYWFKQQNAHWLHTEIPMQSDIRNWENDLNDKEKNVIGNILKGFAQTETEVEDYWSSMITQWIPKPEVKMMAVAFAAFETIHAEAYSYLNDTLGLDDFEAFLHDDATMNKLEVLMEVRKSKTGELPVEDIARSIALFSAAAEGIQLFSSFAVLLSFRKSNRLKGIGQQMIWSVRDESLHSNAGCKLFRTIIDENPQIWTEDLKKSIYDGIELALINEFHYIDKIFEMGNLDTITKDQLKNFMYDRANRKLKDLYLEPTYTVDPKLMAEMEWFYLLISSEQQTDFFDNRETNYSKPNADWHEADLFE